MAIYQLPVPVVRHVEDEIDLRKMEERDKRGRKEKLRVDPESIIHAKMRKFLREHCGNDKKIVGSFPYYRLSDIAYIPWSEFIPAFNPYAVANAFDPLEFDFDEILLTDEMRARLDACLANANVDTKEKQTELDEDLADLSDRSDDE